jgi:hypothetical protein
MYLNYVHGRAMAQAVSSRPVTAEDRIRAWSVHVGVVVDKVALGQVFLRVHQFSPDNINPQWLSILVYHVGDEK